MISTGLGTAAKTHSSWEGSSPRSEPLSMIHCPLSIIHYQLSII